MIWYNINETFNNITEIEVIKDTNDFIITKSNRRLKKQSNYEAYFKTKIECIQWKINIFNNEIKRLNNQIKHVIDEKKKFTDYIKTININK